MNNLLDNVLSQKYRPQILDDLILDPNIKTKFIELISKKDIPNLLFWSNPGSGKTTLAKIIVKAIGCQYIYINAAEERGIDTIRDKVIRFAQICSIDGGFKVVILDEASEITVTAMDALKNVMEETKHVRFILTANCINKLTSAIRSRCEDYNLVPPFDDCVKRCVSIIKAENIKLDPESKDRLIPLIKSCYPDMRRTIGSIQKYTINGVLTIPKIVESYDLVEKIFYKIRNSPSIVELRRFIIENELEFNNDYYVILRGLFDYICNKSDLDGDKKRTMLIIISDYMYRHINVLDKEINTFSCLLQISRV